MYFPNEAGKYLFWGRKAEKKYEKIGIKVGFLKLNVGSHPVTGAEMEFSRTSSWSMVSTLDSLQRFSFQFIKN